MDSTEVVRRDFDELQSTDPARRDAAAERLFNRFWGALVRMARKRLSPEYRKIRDEEDLALSVFASLIRGIEEGRFVFRSIPELWSMLSQLLGWKISKHVKKTKRELDQTLPLPLHDPEECGFPDWLFTHLVTTNEDPEQAAIELFELIDRLPGDQRPVIEMWLACFTKTEIAKALTRSTEWVRQKWLAGLEHLSRQLGCYVEYVAGRFHAELSTEGRPEIERNLELVESNERPRLFRLLLRIELGLRTARGEQVSADDYVGRFPEFRDLIIEEIDRIRRV